MTGCLVRFLNPCGTEYIGLSQESVNQRFWHPNVNNTQKEKKRFEFIITLLSQNITSACLGVLIYSLGSVTPPHEFHSIALKIIMITHRGLICIPWASTTAVVVLSLAYVITIYLIYHAEKSRPERMRNLLRLYP